MQIKLVILTICASLIAVGFAAPSPQAPPMSGAPDGAPETDDALDAPDAPASPPPGDASAPSPQAPAMLDAPAQPQAANLDAYSPAELLDTADLADPTDQTGLTISAV
ncbi:hypothetical protein RMCBS344292_16025 [Rhizopus microsporus]|nr:hypothetical protein RMCBS344292_04974 [Rhizopus microsporus]CEJ02007.1 hypothetical protein RMCBS344292_16025 [Rhizopus microsporus]